MKFTIIASGTHSIDWPIIELVVNGQSCGTAEVQTHCEVDFDINLDRDQNTIELVYVNKQQYHTVFENDRIVSDQSLELKKVRVDDILLDNWFLTQGHYHPAYFAGFLEQFPGADKKLKSQLIWHFPGTFVFETVPNKEKFWHWYRDQRRYVHIKTYADKDGYREENYIGSFDPLDDLVNDIKGIINVQ